MKHRKNKVKREHGIIQNALQWLENLSRLSEVTDIIPGVIDVSHSSERGIVYKYETQTGCKLLLKSNGSIQEVFIVTKKPAYVQEWVKKEFPSVVPSESQILSENTVKPIPKKKWAHDSLKSEHGNENKTIISGRRRSKKSSGKNTFQPNFENQTSPTVADRLDLGTLKSLNQLKKSLETIKRQKTIMKISKFLQK